MGVTYVQNIPEYMQTDLSNRLLGRILLESSHGRVQFLIEVSKSQIDPTTLPMESEHIPLSKRNATYVFFWSQLAKKSPFQTLN